MSLTSMWVTEKQQSVTPIDSCQSHFTITTMIPHTKGFYSNNCSALVLSLRYKLESIWHDVTVVCPRVLKTTPENILQSVTAQEHLVCVIAKSSVKFDATVCRYSLSWWDAEQQPLGNYSTSSNPCTSSLSLKLLLPLLQVLSHPCLPYSSSPTSLQTSAGLHPPSLPCSHLLLPSLCMISFLQQGGGAC